MKPSHEPDPQGWLGTETLQTRFGDFQFKHGLCSTSRSSIARSRSMLRS